LQNAGNVFRINIRPSGITGFRSKTVEINSIFHEVVEFLNIFLAFSDG
jgi:hypothetical protein